LILIKRIFIYFLMNYSMLFFVNNILFNLIFKFEIKNLFLFFILINNNLFFDQLINSVSVNNIFT
jgi:hypothetical protein